MSDAFQDCDSRIWSRYSSGQTRGTIKDISYWDIIYHVYTSVVEVVLVEIEPTISISIYESFAMIYSSCNDVVNHALLNVPIEDLLL